MPEIDYFLMKRAATGWDDECGDTGWVGLAGQRCLLALIDALGHGPEAYKVAVLAEKYVEAHQDQGPAEILNGLHAHLKGTRGAVAAVCELDVPSGGLRCAGVGNISMRLFHADVPPLISRDGILGYMIASPQEQQCTLLPGAILVLSSDGLREHFRLEEFPGLLTGTARQIAAAMLNLLDKGNDDASLIVLRYGR